MPKIRKLRSSVDEYIKARENGKESLDMWERARKRAIEICRDNRKRQR